MDSLSHLCRNRLTPHWRDRRLVLLPGTVKVGLQLYRALTCCYRPCYPTGLRLSVTMLVRSIQCSKSRKLTFSHQNFYPTIYMLNDPHPIAICKSTALPDGSPIPNGERTYANACTIKVSIPNFGFGKCVYQIVAWLFWGTISSL